MLLQSGYFNFELSIYYAFTISHVWVYDALVDARNNLPPYTPMHKKA